MPTLTFYEAADLVSVAYKLKHRDQVTRVTERKLSYTLHLLWQSQQRLVIAEIENYRSVFPSSYLSEALSWQDVKTRLLSTWDQLLGDASEKIRNVIESALTISYNGGSSAEIANVLRSDFPPQFSLSNEAATQWSKENAARLVSEVDGITRQQLRDLLTTARAEGWAYTTTADKINAKFDGFSQGFALRHIRDRAQLVSVTESCNAYEAGSHKAISTLQTYGLVYDKSWLAAGGACENICQANANQGWIDTNSTFQSGDITPSGHPGCRCTALYQRREED